MDGAIIKLILPYLDALGSIALIIMLKIAWSILLKITAIERDLAVYKSQLDSNKADIAKLEARFNEFVDAR